MASNALAVDRKTLKLKAQWVREKVLDMAVKANSGHVSTAFSQCEMLIALYQGGILKVDPKNDKWDGRDRFVLSKGQGGIGYYPVLADMGFFPLADLDRFTQRGSKLGVHAEWAIPGVELLTGSLGHGLPIATGLCQAALNDGKTHNIVVMLGDGELYEGSNWEAAIFAGHMEYDNLICIIDRNRQCTLGFTDDCKAPSDGPRLEPLDKKWDAFGFETRIVDGHDFDAIFEAFSDFRNRKGKGPLMIISNTDKGHGAGVMENRRQWHYKVPGGKDLEAARADLKVSRERIEAGR